MRPLRSLKHSIRPWDSNRSSIKHVQAKTLQTAENWGKADEHFIQFDLCRSLQFRAVLIPSNPMDSFILQSCYGNLLHSRSLFTLQCFYDDVIMYVNRGRSMLKSLKYLCLCAHHGLWCKMSCNAEDQLFQSLSYGQSVRNKWIRCWFRNRSVGLNSVRVRLIHSIKEQCSQTTLLMLCFIQWIICLWRLNVYTILDEELDQIPPCDRKKGFHL